MCNLHNPTTGQEAIRQFMLAFRDIAGNLEPIDTGIANKHEIPSSPQRTARHRGVEEWAAPSPPDMTKRSLFGTALR
jgi:hypothetical protein